jgi:DNA-binding transcriptional regulator LsrR (DeoR family)
MISFMESSTRRQLLADIATLYYKERNTQEEIAKKVGYSRSAISRLLTEAEDEGIIEININYPLMREAEIEHRLREDYRLEAAFVVNAGESSDDHVLQLIGRMGALYLEQQLRDNMVVGIGWGTSLYELVSALPSMPYSNISVVQVIGASGSKSDARIDGPDLAAFLASKLNATHQFLHSPLLLDSEAAKNSLGSQKQIQDTLNLANQADMVLLGIGTIEVDPQFSSIYRSGFVNESDVREIKHKGGIGNFCGVIVDESGSILDIDINHRVMAVDLEKLRSDGRKIIGVASGRRKSCAIQAILSGGWLDVLITDKSAVEFIS